MLDVNKKKIERVCRESKSMAEAASKLDMHFNTFKRYAVKFKCYKPNQSGKGLTKKKKPKYKLEDIISGKHPQYQTYKLKNRLLKAGLKDDKCERCGLSRWKGKRIAIELHHKNGIKSDHNFENLEMLCPNCHSQTETFRSKKRN